MEALRISPLIVKELGGMSRRGWTYLVRTVYVVLTGFLVYGVAGPAISGGRTLFTSEFAELGRRLFHAFTSLQMFFLPLASAIAASDMLHSEARRGTLPLLLLTPMRPWGIVFGKWKAVMLYTATLALSGLPVLAIAAYLGGVGPLDLVWSLTLSLAMSGASAAMALCYSVRDRTVVEAAIRAYLMLQLSVIPYAFVGLFLAIGGLRDAPMMVMAWLHPTLAWAAAANPAESGVFGSWGWVGATLCTGYWVRRYLKAAVQPLVLTREGSKFLDGPAQGGPLRNEESHEAVRPGPIWEEWPLLWKECATRTVRLPNAMRAILLILFALLTLIAFFNQPDGAIIQLAILCPIALLLAVAIGAGHFSRERERRGFEMLLSAPVSAVRIVGAKLVAGLLGMEVLSLLGFIAVGFYSLRTGPSAMELLLTVGSFLAFSYVLASILSLHSSSYRTAFLGAAGVIVFLLIGVPILSDLLNSSPIARTREFHFLVRVLHPTRAALPEQYSMDRDLLVPSLVAIYATASTAMVGAMIFRLRARAGGR
jgi:ABC-type transport system involved in multi-copper enzyme maturation permease subunit